ncbi:putative serine/threonine-protein kinase Nek5-like [Capsicum annuum]|uniref:protein FAF-like, chloroplastic n=1 Tax=Capsicum annuum TaxID=4072 RepID=UPI001FB0882D|nr:protein FAF-like, chloroplastic [Capsicum annuum]KAF3619915.1 putative serine/threonine-protein kinase Nek5-like [Capsicum annuum]KAF3620631.1 putative serine/threonine-protein kinase Nek5-like [Capsicum annuum]
MSTHCVSMIKNFNLSLKIQEEEAISMEKQGIVSILDNVDSTSSSNVEKNHHEKLIKDQPTKTFDMWGSILSSSKNEDSYNKLTPTSPYVHPLVQRSTSSLSEKSLEICTESLGSETGSDCFTSSPNSEREDSDDDINNHHHNHHQQQQFSFVSETSEDCRVYNYSKRLLSSCRSFPPSLPSIHMQSRRKNGRLILEAPYASPKNSLHAQRLDGHLLLTFINQNDTELEMKNLDDEVEEFEQAFDDIQEVEGNERPHSNSGGSGEEEKEDDDTMIKQSPRISSEMTNINISNLTIQEKKNQPTWSTWTVNFSITSDYFKFSNRFNGPVDSIMEEEKDTSNLKKCYTCPSSISQTLSPRREVTEVILTPPPPAATSFNAYEYFWRKKPKVANIVNNSTNNKYCYNNKEVGVATTTLRSCKVPRKSLIIWEPYCIATS